MKTDEQLPSLKLEVGNVRTSKDFETDLYKITSKYYRYLKGIKASELDIEDDKFILKATNFYIRWVKFNLWPVDARRKLDNWFGFIKATCRHLIKSKHNDQLLLKIQNGKTNQKV